MIFWMFLGFFFFDFLAVLGCGSGLKMIVEGMPSFSQSFALSSNVANQNIMFFLLKMICFCKMKYETYVYVLCSKYIYVCQ